MLASIAPMNGELCTTTPLRWPTRILEILAATDRIVSDRAADKDYALAHRAHTQRRRIVR